MAGAPLPTTDIAASLTAAGLSSNMCILKGFPTVLAVRDSFNLWAVALMEAADQEAIQRQFLDAGLDVFRDAH